MYHARLQQKVESFLLTHNDSQSSTPRRLRSQDINQCLYRFAISLFARYIYGSCCCFRCRCCSLLLLVTVRRLIFSSFFHWLKACAFVSGSLFCVSIIRRRLMFWRHESLQRFAFPQSGHKISSPSVRKPFPTSVTEHFLQLKCSLCQ